MSHTLILRLGDCTEVLKGLPEGSLGSIVTDPPYGLEFMGKEWDAPWKTGAGMTMPGIGERAIPWPAYGGSTPFGGANPSCQTCGGRLRGAKKCSCEEPDWRVAGEVVADGIRHGVSEAVVQRQKFQAWCVTWLVECHRVLQPGGIIKVFGATRMFHRMAAAMEEAGFLLPPEHSLEAWAYGSGFPKYLNTSKAIDQHLGKSDERPVLGRVKGAASSNTESLGAYNPEYDATTAATPEAAQFDGYATALKPGWEPFIVGIKT